MFDLSNLWRGKKKKRYFSISYFQTYFKGGILGDIYTSQGHYTVECSAAFRYCCDSVI